MIIEEYLSFTQIIRAILGIKNREGGGVGLGTLIFRFNLLMRLFCNQIFYYQNDYLGVVFKS